MMEQLSMVIIFQLMFLFQFVLISKGENLNDTKRVLNGTAAKLGQFPFVVAISEIAEEYSCSGSLISSKHVITSGHCYTDKLLTSEAMYGRCMAGDINKEEIPGSVPKSRQIRNVTKYAVHPKYKSLEKYDIAVLTVGEPFIMSANVKPIPLSKTDLPTDSWCILAAFGRQTRKKDPYTKPTKANLAWAYFYFHPFSYDDPGVMRYYYPYVAAHFGDSGGPTINDSIHPQLFGVLSSGYFTKDGYHMNFATKIHPHRNWILEQMGSRREADKLRSGIEFVYPSMWLPAMVISTLGWTLAY